MPYDRALPFTYNCLAITSFSGGDGADYVSTNTPPAYHSSQSLWDRLYAAAYEKFAGKVKAESAELGATLAQWSEARSMVIDRAAKLVQGFKAARRGDTKRLKSLWGRGAGVREGLRKQGGNVLEYSFGWAPLVGDLASAVEVFGKGIPPPYVKAGHKYAYKISTGWVDLGAVLRNDARQISLQWTLRAKIRVTNPNALLLNELGLANPATVLWEVVPWSFVVDYFVNVSDFLGSFTDFLGLELMDQNKTIFIRETGQSAGKWDTGYSQSYSPYRYTWERTYVQRSLGIPGPSLVVRLPWRMSMQRASTSIALLLQQLPRKG